MNPSLKKFTVIIGVIGIVLFAAQLASENSAYAYLSPEDVFTDLDIPEAGGAAVTPVENIFEEPVYEQEPVYEPEPVQAAPRPTFFRSGEEVKKSTIPSVDTSSTESPFQEESSLFEEETGRDNEELLIPSLPDMTMEEELEALIEESGEEIIEEDLPAEEVKSAAPKKSVISQLTSYVQYITIAIALTGGAIIFLLKKKKKKKPKTPSSDGSEKMPKQQENVPPTPEAPQQVEASSHRLEHALEAMSEDKTADEGTTEKPE